MFTLNGLSALSDLRLRHYLSFGDQPREQEGLRNGGQSPLIARKGRSHLFEEEERAAEN